MGFFSWYTNDTEQVIWNVHAGEKVATVWMKDNKGNTWKEEEYGGYGKFGGKDYFELLAEMNGLGTCRNKGLGMSFGTGAHLSPNFVTDVDCEKRDVKPKDHEGQGYFRCSDSDSEGVGDESEEGEGHTEEERV